VSFYLVEPWARDRYREATVITVAETVEAAYAERDRRVARLVEQGIDPASFTWYVVDEDPRPVARPGGN
jgi:hypothetical protein